MTKFFLDIYENYEFDERLKAKTLLVLIGAILTAAITALIFTFSWSRPDVQHQQIPPLVIICVALIGSLLLLKWGYYHTSAHLTFFLTCITIWYVMFLGGVSAVTSFDTIVYIYGILMAVPLIIGHRRWLILPYYALNLIAVYIYGCFLGKRYGLSHYELRDFYYDNTVGFFFMAAVSYLLLFINDRALKRAEEEVSKNRELSESLSERVADQTKELRTTQEELLAAAHQAGKAEIATGVLHNIGNTLTGVFVHVDELRQCFSPPMVSNIKKVENLLNGVEDIHTFLRDDSQGRKIPYYFASIGTLLEKERHRMDEALARVESAMVLIRESVRMQQSYANTSFIIQEVDLAREVENMLALTIGTSKVRGVEIRKNFKEVPPMSAQKEKVGHIIANLIKNAFEALEESPRDNCRITISVYRDDCANPIVEISDTGIGISAENLNKIFSFGFTTKEKGHGFGLHHCANAMTEMGGALKVTSDGIGKGATFTMIFYRGEQPGTVTDDALSGMRPDNVMRTKQ